MPTAPKTPSPTVKSDKPGNWPSWKYGPSGIGEIFQSDDEVPEGWVDHPSEALPAIDL